MEVLPLNLETLQLMEDLQFFQLLHQAVVVMVVVRTIKYPVHPEDLVAAEQMQHLLHLQVEQEIVLLQVLYPLKATLVEQDLVEVHPHGQEPVLAEQRPAEQVDVAVMVAQEL